jgi:toxin ParE1/3/4
VNRLVVHARARSDLIEIAEYIGKFNVPAAEAVVDAANATMEKLAEMPLMGRARPLRKPGLSKLRRWPIHGYRSYLIYYLPLVDGVEVLHIRHAARSLRRAF